MREPWDQLPDESNESYARFIAYRNCGPKRSLRLAYWRYSVKFQGYRGSFKRLRISGTWYADCRRFGWVERATAWDVHNLVVYGARIAVLHVQALVKLAEKNLRLTEKLNPGDDEFKMLLQSMEHVGRFITPYIIQAIQERYQSRTASVVCDESATPIANTLD